MYQILIKPAARKELKNLSPAVIKPVSAKIESLAKNPRPHGCKKIVYNRFTLWRVRVGDYRILYAIDDTVKIVDIQHIGHRRDVYRL